MESQQFSIKKRIQSFGHAINGLKTLIKEEHNARIHFFAGIVVIAAGFLLEISIMEWIAIVFAIGFVITVEILNSSIENVADFITPKHHNTIKKIKDLAAAAVLVSAITAFAIGMLVFIPKII